MEKLKQHLTEDQEKSVKYMMFLLERTALYMDYGDEKVVGYSEAVGEVVDNLSNQGLNPLEIALDRMPK